MRTETREVFLAFDDTPFLTAQQCRNYDVTSRLKTVAEKIFGAPIRPGQAVASINSVGKLVDVLKTHREELTDILNELDDREDLV